MNDKNIEEKSEEYAKDCSLCPTLESQDEIDGSHREEIERAYTNAYNQAVTDQQNTLTQYKDALRELVEHICKCPLDLSSDEKVEEATLLDSIINQAKELLKGE